MKTINGFKYSKKQFDDYELRLMIKFFDHNDNEFQMTLYTTQKDVDKAHNDLLDLVTDKVAYFDIFHYATKEVDDLTTVAINEWLNES